MRIAWGFVGVSFVSVVWVPPANCALIDQECVCGPGQT